MIGVNLIPAEDLRRQILRRRLRTWTTLVIPLAGLAAIPFINEAARRGDVQALKTELGGLETKLRGLRQDVSVTAAAAEDMELQIARARALRTKRSWAGLINLIAQCMPPEVWLTSLGTDLEAAARPAVAARPNPAAPASPERPGDPRPTVVELAGATRLQIAGFALSHEQLYDLMSRLKEVRAFGSVDLVRAGRERAGGGEAVKFVLTCEW